MNIFMGLSAQSSSVFGPDRCQKPGDYSRESGIGAEFNKAAVPFPDLLPGRLPGAHFLSLSDHLPRMRTGNEAGCGYPVRPEGLKVAGPGAILWVQ